MRPEKEYNCLVGGQEGMRFAGAQASTWKGTIMPSSRGAAGRVNLKVVAILVAAVIVVGGGLYAARAIRRQVISSRALAAGQAAFDKGDWPAAAKEFHLYLNYNPGDADALRKWGRACLSAEPVETQYLQSAITAHRQLVSLNPADTSNYEMLVRLYASVSDAIQLSHTVEQWVKHSPDSREAAYWQALALVAQGKPGNAAERLESLVSGIESPAGAVDPAHAKACVMLSILAQTRNETSQAEHWLSRALAHDPQAPEPLAYQARLRRLSLSSAASGQEQARMIEAARRDLATADARATENAEVGLMIVEEWTALGDLPRAQAVLDRLDALDRDAKQAAFIDLRRWTLTRFLVASELAMRQTHIRAGSAETTPAAPAANAALAALADQALAELADRGMRFTALPSVIRLYLAAEKLTAAEHALKEYRELVHLLQAPAETQDMATLLGAAMDLANGRPWHALSVLEPITERRTDNILAWQLLVEACRRTDQPKREYQALMGLARARGRSQADALAMDSESLFGLIRGQLAKGELAKVAELARQAQLVNPESAGDFHLIALQAETRMASQAGTAERDRQLAKITEELAALRLAQPTRCEVRVLQANIAQVFGQAQEAEQTLRQAIQECENVESAELALALLLNGMNRPEEALQVAQAACRRHPSRPQPWALLSRLHRQAGQADKAVAALAEGVQTVESPRDRENLQTRLAVLLVLEDQLEEGLAMLRRLAEQYPQSVRTRSLLLSLPEVTNDRSAAQALVDEIRQIQGDAGLQWRLHQADLWLAEPDWRNRQAEIAALLRRCLEADPQWSTPALLLSLMHERMGDLTQAEEVCRRVLAVNPTAVGVADRLVALLMRQNRAAEAMRVLDQLSVGAEATSQRRLALAMDAGNLEEAAAELYGRIDRGTDGAGSRILLARVTYAQSRDAAKALALLDEARAIDGNTAAIAAARVAIVEAEQGPDEARKLLDEYVAQEDSFEAHLLRGVFFQRQGQNEQAEQDYARLVALNDQPSAYAAVAGFYANTGRPDEALKTLRQGIQAHPDGVVLKRDLITTLLWRATPADRAEADALLSDLEQEGSPNAFVLRARAGYLLNDPDTPDLDRARVLLERAADMEPSAIQCHTSLINIAMRQKDYRRAREVCLRALGANPGEPRLLLAQGRVELFLGNLSAAVPLLRQAVQAGSAERDAVGLMTDAVLALGRREDIQEARALVTAKLIRTPHDEMLQVADARLLVRLDRSDEAVQNLESFCQADAGKSGTRALTFLAEMHRVAGRQAEADRWLTQAENAAPEDMQVKQQRLVWFGAGGQFDQAMTLADQMAAKPETPAQTLAVAAGVMAASPEPAHRARAHSLYTQALSRDPQFLPAKLGMAYLAYIGGDVGLSEKLYRDVLATDPDNVQALNDLAWILCENRGQTEEALALADRGVMLNPDDRSLRDTRGVILAKLPGRQRDALRDFQRALALAAPQSPGQARALLSLGRTLVGMGDLEQARQYLNQASQLKAIDGLYGPVEAAEVDRLLEQCTP